MIRDNVKYIAVLLFLLIACSNSYSPKAVSQNFLNAFKEKKFDEAKIALSGS